MVRNTVTGKQLKSLLETQGYRCAYTGESLSPEVASLDHVVPLSRGGEHGISNLAIVHHEVNAAKGTMTLEEFVIMCRKVVAHADRNGDQRAAPA
jgi:5-methylcytosine-specific restriction endonuclease McrA